MATYAHTLVICINFDQSGLASQRPGEIPFSSLMMDAFDFAAISSSAAQLPTQAARLLEMITLCDGETPANGDIFSAVKKSAASGDMLSSIFCRSLLDLRGSIMIRLYAILR